MIFLILSLALSQTPSDASAPVAAGMSTFHGRVVQAEDRAPVAHARAEVHWNRSSAFVSRSHGTPRHEIVAPPPWPSATTDDAGRFSLEYDPALAPWIVVEAENRSPGACGVAAGHADPEHELVFALTRVARLEIDLDLGVPGVDERSLSDGFEVHVDSLLYASSFPAWLSVIADADRREFRASAPEFAPFVLDRVPSGVPLTIEFLRDGVFLDVVEPNIVLRAGETRRIAWSIRPRAGRSALVVAVHDTSGAPIAGATVLVERVGDHGRRFPDVARAACRKTQTDGTFRWEDLVPGDYVVGLGGESYAEPVRVRVGGTEQTVSLAAVTGRFVRGRVLHAHGSPVVGARVTFSPWSDRDRREPGANSGEDGRFELGPVDLQAGIVRATHPTIDCDAITQLEMDAVLEKDGGSRPIPPTLGDLVFPDTSVVAVRVVDQVGAPAAAQIRRGDRAWLGVTWHGVAESTATIELLHGQRVISAVTEDGRAGFALVTVGAEASEVELRLSPAGSVRLRHLEPPELRDLDLSTPDGRRLGLTTLRAGVDEVILVPPGEWVVRARGQADRPIRVEAGVELLVEI